MIMLDEPLIDPRRVRITSGNPETDFWLTGTVNGFPGYSFHAKVFDVGSELSVVTRSSFFSLH
jgi:hypothetical protein